MAFQVGMCRFTIGENHENVTIFAGNLVAPKVSIKGFCSKTVKSNMNQVFSCKMFPYMFNFY